MDSPMARCAKCSAELIGTRKFCSACGAPTASTGEAPQPSAKPAEPAEGRMVQVQPSGPLSQVNPFAATASPVSRNQVQPVVLPPSISGLPAEGRPSQAAPIISPLASSAAVNERGAADAAIAAAQSRPSSSP